MSKLKVAILEDNLNLLKDLKESLEETKQVEVVVYATNSNEFLDKVNVANPEALLLDIDLGGDSMNGLDIATKLKLPVLFVSGKTIEFNHSIEELNMNTAIPVYHISKPITIEKLNKILPKFINEINSINKAKFVYLDFADSKRNKIFVDKIVFIETDRGNSGASNNKVIYFTDRPPKILFNFTLSKMEEKGFDKTKFIKIRSSHRVNVDKIICYNNNHEVEVMAMSENGEAEIKKLSVTEDFRKNVSRFKV
jgi:DNA-binding LytR/AlgR family response regulator